MSWDPRELPDLTDTSYVVTGGARGIGYFVVEQLAAAGASVIVAARSRQRAEVAFAAVRERVPGAEFSFVHLDLASLSSVADAASAVTDIAERLGPVDGLALNAGRTSPTPARELTEEGHELIVGSNYLGHFALLAQSFSCLAPDARVVTMGSMATRLARADLADLMQERRAFSAANAYAYSKHAMQALGFELDRRLVKAGSGIRALVAHPGFALDAQAPRRAGVNDLSRLDRFGQNLLRPMTQGKDRGAWAMVRALTDPDAVGGEYIGPPGGLKGRPRAGTAVEQDRDPAFGAELWRLSEQWTGLRFAL